MARFGFCGPTYQSLSPVADAEWAMNCYPEAIEAQYGRGAMAMIQRDGLIPFAQLKSGGQACVSVLGTFTFAGRSFAVGALWQGAAHLFEVFESGAIADLGALGNPVTSAPVSWAANPLQVALTVGGTGSVYVLTLSSNAIATENLSAGAASSIGYLDGFGVALIAGTNTFMVSNAEDFTTWSASNTGIISEFPDPAVSMIINQRTLWFLGQKSSVPYYNAGALFPFIPVPGAYTEEGSGATYGVAKLDNTFFFLSGNADQGNAMAWRMSGYTPQRISNHAIESIWQSYPTIADAVSYAYQSRGHKFWHVYFPTANASWRYDVATQLWHQVGFWNEQTGVYTAHRSQCHTVNFGLHLVGDPFSGFIYSQSVANTSDNGNPIRLVRRAPYIAVEHDWVFHRALEVLCETGLPSNIQGSSENPGFLNIADANGALWTITISDAGAIAIAASAAGQVASGPVILADNVNQSTFWQLSVTVGGGSVVGTQVNMGNPLVAIFPMGTVPALPNTMPQDTGLQVNQAGVVSSVQVTSHLRAPQLLLRWSDDGGHTWSNYYPKSLGLTGEYKKRAIWRRLGKSRNRVYEVSCADPISLRIIDAFVDADPDFKPTPRLVSQLGKGA